MARLQGQEKFSLGGLVFDAIQFEVPEDLEFSKTTLGGVENIPQTDGRSAIRVSQTEGVICDPIKFDAWFLGDSAEARAQQLEAMQAKQASIVFQRGARTYDVVIYATHLNYHSAHEIKYSVELEPLQESNASASSTASSPASDVSDDTDAINTIMASTPPDARIDTINSGTSSALALLENTGPVQEMSIVNIDDALVAIVAAIDLAQALLGELANSTLPGDVSLYLYVASLAGALGRLNLSLGTFAGLGASPISPNGMNAYQLVSNYTGNIAGVDDFMLVNNLVDPMNLGSGNLVMPGL